MLTDTAATGAAPQARVEPRPVICRGIEDTTVGKWIGSFPPKLNFWRKQLNFKLSPICRRRLHASGMLQHSHLHSKLCPLGSNPAFA